MVLIINNNTRILFKMKLNGTKMIVIFISLFYYYFAMCTNEIFLKKLLETLRLNIYFKIYFCRAQQPRWSVKLVADLAEKFADVRGSSGPIAFGPVTDIPVQETPPQEGTQWKSVKDRPPTPVVC